MYLSLISILMNKCKLDQKGISQLTEIEELDITNITDLNHLKKLSK